MTRSEAIHKAIDIIIYLKAHFAKSQEAKKDAEEIIEALEQIKEEQPVNKLTQQAYEDGKKDGYFQAKADQILKAGWIPVSKMLPDVRNYTKEYLVTNGHEVSIALFTETNGDSWWSLNNVVAWMPLPYGYLPETEKESEKRI